ncbi:hypothetical protein PR002_g16927 [Phytophthora rubi]|uniref:Secreted protein n=1 Tax=Phytophthora rubi TaxID=129364 RepID=A0A6A3KCX1_9STRA|nr:hypothetical protein PR002_g16927 [Phytophthora rubi]
MTVPWARTWAARIPLLLCHATSSGPTCTSGRKWVRTCETCQRVKPSKSSQAPLRPLQIATEA